MLGGLNLVLVARLLSMLHSLSFLFQIILLLSLGLAFNVLLLLRLLLFELDLVPTLVTPFIDFISILSVRLLLWFFVLVLLDIPLLVLLTLLLGILGLLLLKISVPLVVLSLGLLLLL